MFFVVTQFFSAAEFAFFSDVFGGVPHILSKHIITTMMREHSSFVSKTTTTTTTHYQQQQREEHI
jgi:ascorbate-specific PTS system EIIC-type component UlaA